MIFLRTSEFSELLLMEFRKTGRRYLQVLVIYSCACNGGWSLDFLIGYRSLAINVLAKMTQSGMVHFCVLSYNRGLTTYSYMYLLPLEH